MALQVLCLLERQPDLSVEQGLKLYFQNLVGGEVEETPINAPQKPDRGSSAVLDELEAYSDQKAFTEDLVHGVRSHQKELDALLTRCSRNWRIERMSWVDRNLLRLACFELHDSGDTPARVVLNEAIEIARRYSTSESSGFVNGVLDRAMQELGKKSAEAKAANRPNPLYSKDHAPDPR